MANHPQLIILTLFLPSHFLIPLFPFYFLQFQRVPNRFPIDVKNWIPKLGFHQLVSKLRFLKLDVIYPLYFLFLVCFLLCLLFPFCLTLYYYFIFLCFISLSLSFVLELYPVSISYIYIYIYIYPTFVQKKERKKYTKI